MGSYRELVVWKKSMQMISLLYSSLVFLPNEEAFALSSQMRRSAISVPSNIAEGQGRGSDKEFVRFLSIAYGSLCELETQIEICKMQNYYNEDTYENLLNSCQEIGKMINGLINKLKQH